METKAGGPGGGVGEGTEGALETEISRALQTVWDPNHSLSTQEVHKL